MPYPKFMKKKSKSTSYFSHEYITANHSDIVSFIAMLIVIGLMFQISAPFSKLFIILQHNVTIDGGQSSNQDSVNRTGTLYTAGHRDLLTCLFYSLIAIVIHAVLQEYVVDRFNRRLHLSKQQLVKANESGQLLLFYSVSFVWGANIVYRERLVTSISTLWVGYPHLYLSFWFKFYFICQICYWLHCFPELYFQRVNPSEVPERAKRYAASLICVAGAYLLNLNRIAVLLMVLHYSAELIFHTSRLLKVAGKLALARYGFVLWNVMFVAVRIMSVAMASLTFILGLEKNSRDQISIREGNFNTKFIRLNCLALVCLLQGYQMWTFITFHVRRAKEFSDSYVEHKVTSPKRLRRSIIDRKGFVKRFEETASDEDNQFVRPLSAIKQSTDAAPDLVRQRQA